MGKFKEMDLLRQEREAFDADYPMEPTPMVDMWIAWNSEDGFTFWKHKNQAALWSASDSNEWPVKYEMQKAQPAPWVGLTFEDKRLFSSWLDDKEDDEVFTAIEALLKEKNRG
jgi:hypothetical protein